MSKLVLPLKESVGVPVTPIVSVGDHVKRGQLIGKPDGLGANLHASVYGTVTEINDKAIVIEADDEQPAEYVKIPDTDSNLVLLELVVLDSQQQQSILVRFQVDIYLLTLQNVNQF